ncbi:diguanylate cyclase [Allohahella marinimesophila]
MQISDFADLDVALTHIEAEKQDLILVYLPESSEPEKGLDPSIVDSDHVVKVRAQNYESLLERVRHLVRQCRQTENNALTPVIVVVDRLEETTLHALLVAGATDVIKSGDSAALDRLVSDFQMAAVLPDKPLHMLYVEDSPSIYTLFIEYFNAKGFRVSHFTSARNALKSTLKEDYDVVVADVMVEGTLTGLSLVRSIKGSAQGRLLPCFIVSGLQDQAQKMQMLAAGADDVLIKPVSLEELHSRVVGVWADYQERRRIEQEQSRLETMALTDQLTGLLNRHALESIAQRVHANALRHDGDYSVLMCDIDHFKQVNDRFGHQAGDDILQAVAKLMSQHTRTEDYAFRIGGEELVLLLPNCSLVDAVHKADRFRWAVQTSRPLGIDITMSIGVACLSQLQGLQMDVAQTGVVPQDHGFSNILAAADAALYRAKANGRNQVESAYNTDLSQAPDVC